MLSIDEAIAKYNKLANNDRTCHPEEAQQLAEWLEELKELRTEKDKFERNIRFFNEINVKIYNKAIDDFMDILFAERTQCYNFDDSEHNNPIKCVWWSDIEGIAEQLKEAVKEYMQTG